jgi:hypothetical protein
MSLCPEAAERAEMPDDQFWEFVYRDHYADAGPDDEPLDDVGPAYDDGCPTCGARGACGYDHEGRPMIHTTEVDLDD